MHVLVSSDWGAIEYRDPGTRMRKGALDLSAVLAVNRIPGSGHKRGMMTRRDAEPRCCLILECDEEKRCVSAAVRAGRAFCVAAAYGCTCACVCLCTRSRLSVCVSTTCICQCRCCLVAVAL